MERLIDGVRRFQSEVFREKVELFRDLASGQKPSTLFITCADSRVVPHLITSSEPGDLFVIRNAGNLVQPYTAASSGEGASIEFAVSVLGVREIVVCGHSDCGAMKGVLNPDSLTEVPSVARWLESAQPTQRDVESRYGSSLSESERLARAIEINALRQLENLRGHPAVASALSRNQLTLHAWVYDIGSGVVSSYDEDLQKFVELNEPPAGQGDNLAAAG